MAGKSGGDGDAIGDGDVQRPSGEHTEPLLAPPLPSFAEESAWIFRQAAALFISQVSWVAMKSTDSAVLGHVGTRYLSASSVSDFWTMSTGVFIQGRVLGTFCGNAYGAGNYALVGVWLQVSYAVLAVILIPVLALWLLTEPLLKLVGEDDQISGDAGYYAMVLAAALPVRILFSQVTQFFTAQGLTKPAAQAAPIIMFLNLVLGIVVVLGWPIPHWGGLGFKACPVITAGLEYLQILLVWYVFCHRQRLHEKCWTGWSWECIKHDNYSRVKRYLRMYVPAAFSIASDFWRMAFIGGVATWIGKDEAAVFNTSYRILWIALIFVGAVVGAVGIKLGQQLGKGRPGIPAAKQVIHVGFVYIMVFDVGLSAIVWAIPRQLAAIFSSDDKVLTLFEDSRWPLAWLTFVMTLSVALERVPMVMGRTKGVFVMGLLGSWVGQVPGVLLCVRFWKKDLTRLYCGAAAGYTLLCVLYAILCIRTDWNHEADQALHRAEQKGLQQHKESSDTPDEDADPEQSS
eukprot:TRINITY_DN12031_c0_g1_i1.p1 TRINITY_DN12031_c0_g1~~TRINITY_DN12031_c0_g1_i1.p1  ORF type:complete len:533 (+),score=119.83 TRINITY_DN12031_c0_g1_i1:56-1600(+)